MLFKSDDNTDHLGKIIRINNSIDDDSQSIRLFIEFESSKLKDGLPTLNLLLPGFFLYQDRY